MRDSTRIRRILQKIDALREEVEKLAPHVADPETEQSPPEGFRFFTQCFSRNAYKNTRTGMFAVFGSPLKDRWNYFDTVSAALKACELKDGRQDT